MDKVQLIIPSDPGYITTLRLVTASVASKLQFDIEEVEDLRLCVSEAVNYLFPLNETIELVFTELEEGLEIRINAKGGKKDQADLHWMILESLMDDVEEKEGSVILIKRH